MQIQNRLLVSLKPEDLELLAQHLSEIRIQQGELLEEPDRPLEAVYFPQSGMISLVVQMPEDIALEVGTVGAEGAIGMAVGLGSRRSFICALVQVLPPHFGFAISSRRESKFRDPRAYRQICGTSARSNSTDCGM
ncbi:MAG: cyclic nucleotide-binding domain-containing protein [Bradyrhizobium sp.]|uniref:hypothetical protein n=1 Tax=Bradyrhizobium sp. TaxID=376 RepID=UPI003C7B0A9E